MGKDIVRQECREDPGKRSRLWLNKDIDDVLTKNTGTKEIQGIALELHEQQEMFKWNPEAFSEMQNLKFLKLDSVHLIYIERLWKGAKSFGRLKFIELNGSQKLIETPDITKALVLEKLDLEDHIWLISLHPHLFQTENGKSMWECDANGFTQIRARIQTLHSGGLEVKKCGLRLVYKKDIEDLSRTMTQRHHNFDNSMAAAEGYRAKRTRDDYDEAGSSNDEPHPKRIGNSNYEESSEYKDCREELSESDLES
ncbi:hypothetical protein CMV_022418 [Castanea mollissima]|uniref:Uncharacterized protein n=1 Tax=Castanea mollissima TaxID=60419 RepID=A0A8J4QID6_9ROSI|nr:hypothetical protein CMV_022418 [Castanea mollissima]